MTHSVMEISDHGLVPETRVKKGQVCSCPTEGTWGVISPVCLFVLVQTFGEKTLKHKRTHTRTHTYTRIHTRTHAYTHVHTQCNSKESVSEVLLKLRSVMCNVWFLLRL